jgi:hypothetical protein
MPDDDQTPLPTMPGDQPDRSEVSSRWGEQITDDEYAGQAPAGPTTGS